MKIFAILILVMVTVVAIVGPQGLFVVDETQLAIVTRFGDPIRDHKQPGLYLKVPFLDQVIYLDKRLLVFDAPPDSLLTKDKKNLIIDVYARGYIVDPKTFVKTVATEREGRNRVIEIVSSELRREIATDNQSEIIKTSRESVMDNIKEAVKPKVKEFGIEVIDVRIKRADFPDQIASSVYERMKAERKRIADRERALGAKKDSEVRANADKLSTIILSSAERDSDIIRGCGEASAIRIFAKSLEQDPEFYTFQRSLEVYKPSLTQNTVMYGSADDFGRMFENIRRSFADSSSPPQTASSSVTALNDDVAGQLICEQLDAQTASRQLLSNKFKISSAALRMTKTEKINWPDTSMGCSVEDTVYAQTIVPGYRFSFELEDIAYEAHSNHDGSHVVECLDNIKGKDQD